MSEKSLRQLEQANYLLERENARLKSEISSLKRRLNLFKVSAAMATIATIFTLIRTASP